MSNSGWIELRQYKYISIECPDGIERWYTIGDNWPENYTTMTPLPDKYKNCKVIKSGSAGPLVNYPSINDTE